MNLNRLTAAIILAWALCVMLPSSAVAQVSFSQLPSASAFGGTEIFPLDQSGVTSKGTLSQLKTYMNAPTVSGTFTAGNMLVGGPGSTQVQDASAFSATYVNLPAGLNITKTINFGSGAGTVDGPNNQVIYAPYTQNTAAGKCALSSGAVCHFSQFGYIDQVDASPNVNGLWAFEWSDVLQSSGKGSRVTGTFNFWYQGSADNAQFYAALQSEAKAGANGGGTSGAGNGVGDFFGFNPKCSAVVSGAAYFHQCVGIETNLNLQSPASFDQVIGHQVVQVAAHNISGLEVDIAYSVNNQAAKGTAPGWDILLSDGSFDGYPGLKAAGAIFKCYPHANNNSVNPCGTIGYGIDLFNYSTVTNYILRGPGGNITIDGSGNVATSGALNTSNGGAAIGLTNNGAVIVFRNGNTFQTSPANGVMQFGLDGASPAAQTIQIGSVATGNGNTAAANLTLRGGLSNGTGGGDIHLQTTLSSASSGVQNTAADAIILKGGSQAVQLPAVTTGTPVASICLDGSNNIIKKTTTGSCV